MKTKINHQKTVIMHRTGFLRLGGRKPALPSGNSRGLSHAIISFPSLNLKTFVEQSQMLIIKDLIRFVYI